MQRPHSQVASHSVAWFDELTDEQAADELRTCCAADTWVHAMLGHRPFGDLQRFLNTGEAAAQALDDDALEQALAAHARIGERRAGITREDSWSRTEQAGALTADEDLQRRLAEGNRAYEERFGHVFLIRAAGRSAAEMYDALQARLGNDDATERSVVRQELAEIVRLRLAKLVTR
ncbi:MAG TPA: 2-oxo-4-hydroxy-4-carboxy-5-ureidoimidazoline decarboxylase [Nocardioidaceae bacterium]|nr:2-oxo-4-hydroxy-4-carboxy-5-ureidoimidazoline decarboxylase [Nocardioidaceae bacterium]